MMREGDGMVLPPLEGEGGSGEDGEGRRHGVSERARGNVSQ